MQQVRPVDSSMKRATSTLLTFLAACHLCGAFLPAPATTTASTAVFQRRVLSSPPPARGQRGKHRASSARMQQSGSSDEELHAAVSKLAAQVEDLTAMVAQLAAEPAGGAGSSKDINGAVVGAGAAAPGVPVVSTKAKGESKPPLVSTSAAQQRIEQWLQESGGGVTEVPAAPAAPVAQASVAQAPVAPTTVPEVAAPPAEEAPAAGSGYKVKIEWEGAIHEVTCDEETTLLEAAMDAGLELPSSCMSGSCLTCPGKLVSGSVDQSEGVLEDEQTEAGFLLTCVSYPTSDVHFAVVDEEDLP